MEVAFVSFASHIVPWQLGLLHQLLRFLVKQLSRGTYIHTEQSIAPSLVLAFFFCKHTSSLCILTLCAERYIEMAGRKASLCRLFMIAHIRARGGRYEKQQL